MFSVQFTNLTKCGNEHRCALEILKKKWICLAFFQLYVLSKEATMGWRYHQCQPTVGSLVLSNPLNVLTFRRAYLQVAEHLNLLPIIGRYWHTHLQSRMQSLTVQCPQLVTNIVMNRFLPRKVQNCISVIPINL